MAPRIPKQAEPAENTLDELVATVKSLSATTEAMREQLTASSLTINGLSTRLSSIESILKITQAENLSLKEELKGSYQEVNNLKGKLNNLEQHHRSWSIRVTGLNIPASEEQNVKEHLYDRLLKPILVGAVAKNILPHVPSCSEILERAHTLPAKNGGTKSIIARFYCRDMRALIFQLKKEFAPREPTGAPATASQPKQRPARFLYQIFDDLTRANFLKMKAMGDDKRVDQCWSSNGHLKYRLAGQTEVKSVWNAFDPVDVILSPR